jgi:drug/metabolite transporter (DMT)-like permease
MPLEAWLFALGAAFLFGFSLNLAQLGLKHLPVELGSMVSIPTAAALFWLSSPWTADFSGWRWDAGLLFLLVGLFYPAVVTILTFEASRWLGANITAALGNLAPVVAVMAGIVVLGEALGARQFAGIAVLLCGIMLLTTRRASSAGPDWPAWALLLPLSASVLRGLAQPLLKIGFGWWHNPRVATLCCYVSSATVVILVGLFRKRSSAAAFTPKGVAYFMLVGVGNGLATWAGIEAVARGPVSLVAPVVASYPLFTLVLGLVMLGHVKVSRMQALGVALTAGGVMVLVMG